MGKGKVGIEGLSVSGVPVAGPEFGGCRTKRKFQLARLVGFFVEGRSITLKAISETAKVEIRESAR